MFHQWRAAVRSLARRPALTIAVVVTLALGIGANSAIFSAVDAVLLKPLPFPDGDRLVAVYESNLARRQATQLVAPGRLEEWNRSNRTFVALAAHYFENMTDTTGPLPERVEAMRISPRFFSVLRVSAALGRTPTPQEELFGGPSVIVVSDAFWRNRLHGDPSAIGRKLILGGANRTVIGVMPPSFRYPYATTEVWVPAQSPAMLMEARRARFYKAVGRLKEGVTIEQSQEDLTRVQAALGEQFPETDKGWGAAVVALKEEQIGGVRRTLWLLLGAVALVLLAACGNVACLLLADSARRERDIAIRFAIGADRVRVVAELLREGALLALAGTGVGLLLAAWGMSAMRAAATQLPRAADIHVDARLVAFTMAIGSITTLVFALAPALRAARKDPADALSRGGRAEASGHHALQRVLVAAQVALAIVLLVGAGLLVRSFTRLQQVSPGLDPDHVLTFRMSAQWSEQLDAVVQRQARTIRRLELIPGVASAALSQVVPAATDYPPSEFHIIGRDPAEKTFAHTRSVSAGYFRTLRIPILQGETCRDDPAAPAFSKALVTRAFTDRFFANDDPRGHALIFQNLPPGQTVEIVGVVGDVRERGLLSSAEPVIYMCGYSPYWPDPIFLVRTDAAHPASVTAIRAALREIEPRRAVYAVSPLAERLRDSVAQPRLNTLLLTLFAAVALLLAAMGLYGVLSQLVAGRRREIGLRMALGEPPARILRSVVMQAAAVTVAGIASGLAGAFAAARLMASLVFEIPPVDPLTFAAAPAVLAAVALATAFVPARRAALVNPVEALRE